MNKKEKLALFLGMLSGDGCLPIKHSGEGYRDYAVQFYNTNKDIMILFQQLLFELFGLNSKIRHTDRENKKRLFEICKYSKDIVNKIKQLGFPEGVKRDILRVPDIIKNGERNEKISFIIGLLITDGCLRKQGSILFHSGSKLLLEDVSELLKEIIGEKKKVNEFIQRDKFKSYQLNLNKQETKSLLSQLPTWDNGTPAALSSLNM